MQNTQGPFLAGLGEEAVPEELLLGATGTRPVLGLGCRLELAFITIFKAHRLLQGIPLRVTSLSLQRWGTAVQCWMEAPTALLSPEQCTVITHNRSG